MKICTTCKAELPESEFYKDKHHHTGYKSSCKKCCKEKYVHNIQYYVQYRKDNKEKRSAYDKTYIKKNYSKDEKAKYDKTYRQNNKESRRNYNKAYISKNKERIAEKRRLKYATNPIYAEAERIRRLITISITSNGYSKKSKTQAILGCTYEEFMVYIENKFTDGMSWENRQLWHLDHIYPVSKAENEEHLLQLNHHTNFQPLWAEDNLKKGNKI